jgi:hypothetical protein
MNGRTKSLLFYHVKKGNYIHGICIRKRSETSLRYFVYRFCPCMRTARTMWRVDGLEILHYNLFLLETSCKYAPNSFQHTLHLYVLLSVCFLNLVSFLVKVSLNNSNFLKKYVSKEVHIYKSKNFQPFHHYLEFKIPLALNKRRPNES